MLSLGEINALFMQKSSLCKVMSDMASLPGNWNGYMMLMLKLIILNVLKATATATIGSFFFTFAMLFYVGWPPYDWGVPSFQTFDLALPIITLILSFLCFKWSQVPTFWYDLLWIFMCYTMSAATGLQFTLYCGSLTIFLPALISFDLSFWFVFLYHAISACFYGTILLLIRVFQFLLSPPSLASWHKLIVHKQISSNRCFGFLLHVAFFLSFVSMAECVETEFTSSIPQFKNTRLHFPGWMTAFAGWISMKYPDLVDLIQGDWEEPEEPDEDDEEAKEAYKKYWNAQKQLYGCLIGAVPAGVKQSLSANAKFNGTRALELLQSRFGVVDANDRASALKRVAGRYIDPGSGISLKDATRQYDKMTEAHTEFTDAGGTAIDDELLRTYFFNALPVAYQPIKMAIRTKTYANFDEMVDAFMVQVKAAEDDVAESRNGTAFSGQQQLTQLMASLGSNPTVETLAAAIQSIGNFGNLGGRGKGKGGGRGRGDGGGRGRGAFQTFATCLRCGILGHGRLQCTKAVTQCIYCAADHLSALCLRGPGGSQRDALSAGARDLLSKDTQRASSLSQANLGNVQQQLQAFLASMQSALAPTPAAAPATTATSSDSGTSTAHAAASSSISDEALLEAMRARFPQFGATAQQHGFFALQASSPIARFSEACRLLLYPLTLLFSVLISLLPCCAAEYFPMSAHAPRTLTIAFSSPVFGWDLACAYEQSSLSPVDHVFVRPFSRHGGA